MRRAAAQELWRRDIWTCSAARASACCVLTELCRVQPCRGGLSVNAERYQQSRLHPKVAEAMLQKLSMSCAQNVLHSLGVQMACQTR